MWAYEIFIPIAIVVGIGLVLGLVLAVAAIILHVPVDERVEAVTEVLPGANCGACGYSGCSGYASALCAQFEDDEYYYYVKAVPKMVFAPRADRKLFKKSVNY